MTIGATVGKEPNYTEDEDVKTLDELRGVMKDIDKAKMSMGEKATVQGVATEIEVMKQQNEKTHEQLRRLIGMYQTLDAEFKQFKQQRIIELQRQVNGGSTTPEDQTFEARASGGSTTPSDYE
jgi:hypothetical protein